MNPATQFKSVGIIGLGYVGLPLAVAFAEAGLSVVAVDNDPRRVAAIREGNSYIEDVPSERLRAASICATTHYARLARVDAVIICVPTPLTPQREPDLTALRQSSASLANVAQEGQLIVLESTTYPGTTREILAPMLESRADLIVGDNINVAFSPERVDPGNTTYNLRNTPKVVGGMTVECTNRAVALYEAICDQLVPVSTPEAAELTKLLENIFRAVNIALVNELGMLAERMGIDIYEVIDAADTKPYGFMRFEPGPGMGGHCLPIDPFYLTWRAREFHMTTEFIELAGKVNQMMPSVCVARIVDALNEAHLSANDANILLLGVSYKSGIGDMRESPALRIIDELEAKGAIIDYHDPYVPSAKGYESIADDQLDSYVEVANAVVLVTAHPGIDYDALREKARVFVDLRGVTRHALTSARP